MKTLLLAFTAVLFTACIQPSEKKQESVALEAEVLEKDSHAATQEEILVGEKKRKDLLQGPYQGWFEANYDNYEVNEEVVEQLKPLVSDIEVVVFMGTWCEGSREEVPAFFKLLDQVGVSENQLRLVTMTREKTTPENLEQGFDVTMVPTLIFVKDGKEINRIVEYPLSSLEEDMLQILSGEDYKHAYDW